jgi:hypothetical protein
MDPTEVAGADDREWRRKNASAANELMRAERRTRFATPFVVVVGCSSPAVPPVEEPLRPEPAPFVIPAVAEPSVPTDASVVATPLPCNEQVDCKDCKIEMFKGGTSGVGRVTSIRGEEWRVRLEVELPKKLAVFSWYRAFFVDENLESLAAPELKITRTGTGRMTVEARTGCELPSKLVYVWNAPPEVPVCQRPGVRCNPPHPDKPTPLEPISGRVIKTEYGADSITVWISAGTDVGVTRNATARFESGEGCQIIYIGKRETICKLVGTKLPSQTLKIAPQM